LILYKGPESLGNEKCVMAHFVVYYAFIDIDYT